MNYTEYLDQGYAQNHLQSQRLYLAVPQSNQPLPCVVYVHGGAWWDGTFPAGARGLAEARDDAKAFLEAGWAVAIINYRLSTEARWPAQIHDCKAAIRLLRTKAGEYGIDPDRIVAWGSSAGAHLVQMLVMTKGVERFEDRTMGNPEASSAVNAAISSYGISDISQWTPPDIARHDGVERCKSQLLGEGYDADQAADASPITHVAQAVARPNGLVPMLLAHSDDDDLVPCEQTHRLEERIREAGAADRIETWYPAHGGHGEWFLWRSREATDRFVEFAERAVRS